MIILFVNAHIDTEEGNIRFGVYIENIKKLLKNTVYFGNQIQQVIRTKHQLQDLLFDQTSFRCDQKAKQKFQSIEYVFIDGSTSILPWSTNMKQVLLLIKMCVRSKKKFHFNGFAHFALYFYLTTKFEKDYTIKSQTYKEIDDNADYHFDEETGDLFINNKKVNHCGIRVSKTNSRPFSSKSSQALSKGIVLPTKFHYLVFDSKNGQKIINNLQFPFTFYFRGKLFCTPKQISKTKVQVLVETENKIPLAFTYELGLSTHGLSAQFLKIIANWLCQVTGSVGRQIKTQFQDFKQISVDNLCTYKKNLVSNNSHFKLQSRINSAKNRPQSSKFSQQNFQKPSLRCSGPYETIADKYLADYSINKSKFIGRSRMIFKSKMQENQIKNYVVQTPSRPPSAHKYRQTNKEKWVCKNTFFLS